MHFCHGCSVERASRSCLAVSSLVVRTRRQCEEGGVQIGFVMDRAWLFHLRTAGESCWPCLGVCFAFDNQSSVGLCHATVLVPLMASVGKGKYVLVYPCSGFSGSWRCCSRRVWSGCVYLGVVSTIECLICRPECDVNNECK